jgi:hypothetical protein
MMWSLGVAPKSADTSETWQMKRRIVDHNISSRAGAVFKHLTKNGGVKAF